MNMSMNNVSTPVVNMPIAEKAKEEFIANSSISQVTEQSIVVNTMTDGNTYVEKTADEVDGKLVLEKRKEKSVEIKSAEGVKDELEANKEFVSGSQVEEEHASKVMKTQMIAK